VVLLRGTQPLPQGDFSDFPAAIWSTHPGKQKFSKLLLTEENIEKSQLENRNSITLAKFSTFP